MSLAHASVQAQIAAMERLRTMTPDEALSPGARLLLLVLCAFVSPSLQCFPSRAELMALCGTKSERTVVAHVQELVAAKLLRVEAEHTHTGRQTSNVYTLLLDVGGPFKPAGEGVKPRRGRADKRGGPGVEKGPPKPQKPKPGPVEKAVDRPKGREQKLPPHRAIIAPSEGAKIAPLEPDKGTKRRASAHEPNGGSCAPGKGARFAHPSYRPPSETPQEMAARIRALAAGPTRRETCETPNRVELERGDSVDA